MIDAPLAWANKGDTEQEVGIASDSQGRGDRGKAVM